MDANKQLTQSPMTAKALFNSEEVKQKFQELLGKRSTSFITSVLQIVASNDLLAKAQPTSVYQAAAVAATLDLPLNNNLGFAYIVPYNHNFKDADGNWQTKTVAQFQLGYKGFKQLALRSGQFLTLNATDVRDGEIVKHNRLTGEIEFSWIENEEEREKQRVVGYVSFFRLVNGFSQTFYMSVEELTKHGKKYSQTFKKNFGLWKDDFHSMALKTVTKLNLSKNAPLSVEMQRAVTVDQSIINDSDTMDVTYVDNHEPEAIDKEAERVALLIQDAKSLEDLEKVAPHVKDEQLDLYTMKKDELTAKQ